MRSGSARPSLIATLLLVVAVLRTILSGTRLTPDLFGVPMSSNKLSELARQ